MLRLALLGELVSCGAAGKHYVQIELLTLALSDRLADAPAAALAALRFLLCASPFMQKQLRAFAAAFAKFGHVEDDAADADGDADAPDHARPLSDGRLRGAWLRGASAASRARLLSSSEGDWAFDDRVARRMAFVREQLRDKADPSIDAANAAAPYFYSCVALRMLPAIDTVMLQLCGLVSGGDGISVAAGATALLLSLLRRYWHSYAHHTARSSLALALLSSLPPPPAAAPAALRLAILAMRAPCAAEPADAAAEADGFSPPFARWARPLLEREKNARDAEAAASVAATKLKSEHEAAQTLAAEAPPAASADPDADADADAAWAAAVADADDDDGAAAAGGGADDGAATARRYAAALLRSVVETLAAAEAGAAPVGFPEVTFETPGAAPRALLAARLELFVVPHAPAALGAALAAAALSYEGGHYNAAALAAAGAGGDTQAAALAAGWLAAHGRPALRAALHARAAEALVAAVHGVGVGGAYEPTEAPLCLLDGLWRASSVRAAADEALPLLASLTSIATAAGEGGATAAARAAAATALRVAPLLVGALCERLRALGRGGAAAKGATSAVDPSRTLNKIVAALTELSTAASLAAASEEAYKADAAALDDLLAHVAWGAEG